MFCHIIHAAYIIHDSYLMLSPIWLQELDDERKLRKQHEFTIMLLQQEVKRLQARLKATGAVENEDNLTDPALLAPLTLPEWELKSPKTPKTPIPGTSQNNLNNPSNPVSPSSIDNPNSPKSLPNSLPNSPNNSNNSNNPTSPNDLNSVQPAAVLGSIQENKSNSDPSPLQPSDSDPTLLNSPKSPLSPSTVAVEHMKNGAKTSTASVAEKKEKEKEKDKKRKSITSPNDLLAEIEAMVLTHIISYHIIYIYIQMDNPNNPNNPFVITPITLYMCGWDQALLKEQLKKLLKSSMIDDHERQVLEIELGNPNNPL